MHLKNEFVDGDSDGAGAEVTPRVHSRLMHYPLIRNYLGAYIHV